MSDNICQHCEGDGNAHGSDRPFEWSGPGTYPGKCPVCNGTGLIIERRPIFKQEPPPVPNVVVVASEPTEKPETLDDDLPDAPSPG